MSVVEKMHHTNVYIGESDVRAFDIPRQKMQALLDLLAEYEVKDASIPAEIVHQSIYNNLSKPGAILQGFRLRDELTQEELAAKMKTSQSAIAALESGQRAISKKVALKLAKIFNTKPEAFCD